MDVNDVSKRVMELFPKKAIDIAECLGLLLDTLDSTIAEINRSVIQACEKRDFSMLDNYTLLMKNINEFEIIIETVKDSLEPVDDIIAEVSLEDEIEDKKMVPNYEDYNVDSNIPHTLYENFTHKRPCAFDIKGAKIEVKTWQEMLLETCEILINLDKDKFWEFINDPRMNGKKIKYFSKTPDGVRKPEKLRGADVFVETNMSANGRRNIIVKMLQKYNMKASEFKVFFRADYSGLHTDD